MLYNVLSLAKNRIFAKLKIREALEYFLRGIIQILKRKQAFL